MGNDRHLSPADADRLGRENNAALLRLQLGWDHVYDITVTWPGQWRAVRIGEETTVLEADSAPGLREMMIRDHERRPLPHRPAGRDD